MKSVGANVHPRDVLLGSQASGVLLPVCDHYFGVEVRMRKSLQLQAEMPSHCVVTEFNHTEAMKNAAKRAAFELGYARMWSIHPNQIRPILEAFAPGEGEIDEATKIMAAAARADWASTSFNATLHDRASYRFLAGA